MIKRSQRWIRSGAKPTGPVQGVFIENFQEVGVEGLCHAEPWMLAHRPGTLLDESCRGLMRLVAFNCAMHGKADRAEQIAATLEAYARQGDDGAKCDAKMIRMRIAKPDPFSKAPAAEA